MGDGTMELQQCDSIDATYVGMVQTCRRMKLFVEVRSQQKYRQVMHIDHHFAACAECAEVKASASRSRRSQVLPGSVCMCRISGCIEACI